MRGAIVRITKTSAILKRPLNKLFAVENTYHDTNQTDKASHRDFWSMMGEERLNAFLFVCIDRDIFFDYDKIIEIYAAKYPRRMPLINPLTEN